MAEVQQFTKEDIIKLLSDVQNQEDVEKYAAYCYRLLTEKDKDKQAKNPFMKFKKAEDLAKLFRRVAAEGLVFDGVHVTLQSTGISYDYIALKNKMYLVYPESIIDIQLVGKGDEFSFEKNSGKIEYFHRISNPFGTTEKDIIGGYVVVKNRRGEFLTTLSAEELEKHRKTAKTDSIWKQWFKEMALKTIMKKACKLHFQDVYASIEEQDNENNDIENPLDLDLKFKQEIDELKTREEVKEYWQKNRGKGKDLDKYVSLKLKQLGQ